MPTRSPVSTRFTTSPGRSTLVGVRLGSISACGSIELPPDAVFSDPASVKIEPLAPRPSPSGPIGPARAMPYIGLCGLLPVSLSERAGMTAPLINCSLPAVRLVRMPRRNALSRWKPRPRSKFSYGRFRSVSTRPGIMSPGSPIFW